MAVSLDDKTYTPITSAQNIEMFQKWGSQTIPISKPITGRYIRLRYHHDGAKENAFRMPTSLSVYDGVADEKWDLPKAGVEIGAGEFIVKTSPNGSGTAPIKVPKPLASGMYLLATRFENGAYKELIFNRILVLPNKLASVTADSRFGINAADPKFAPILRRLGVGWVRFENMKWPFVSPEPGKYFFDGSVKPWVVNTDNIFKTYTDQGISVLPFLFETALYASSAPETIKEERRFFYPPKDNSTYGEFAYQVAARYGATKHSTDDLKTTDGKSALGTLHTFEIWNEPNLTDPGCGPWVGTNGQFLEMFRVGAENVKKADPTAKVSSSGYAGIQVKTVDELRSYTYADGKHPIDFVDILNVHFYSGRVAPELSTDDFNAKQTGDIVVEDEFHNLIKWRDKTKPGLPIWLSETGYDSAGPFGTNERTQCARLPRVIMIALSSGIDKVFVYRESGSDASMHAASGLLRNDGSYKPSFLTYSTLIRELDGVKGGATHIPLADKNARLYIWKKGNEYILTAWTIEGSSKLAVNLGSATVTNAFGHRTQQDLTKGIDLSIYPVYIRHITNKAAIDGLLNLYTQDVARKAARQKALAGVEVVALKFGGGAENETIEVGTPRHYSPVKGADTYTDAKGFGFMPGPATDDSRAWISSVLDKTNCKLNPGQEFRIRVKPGKYHLRLGVSPYNDANMTIKGAVGGDVKFLVDRGDIIVERDIEVGSAPLSLSVDAYNVMRWLTLVQKLD